MLLVLQNFYTIKNNLNKYTFLFMKDGGLFILAVFVQSIYSVCIQIKLIENALLSCYDD